MRWSFVITDVSVLLLLKLVECSWMDELASVSVWAILVLMKLLTQLRFVSRWHVLLLLQLALSMSKSAGIAIGTASFLLEGAAELCLYLDFVVFWHDSAVILECKWVVAGVCLIDFVDPLESLIRQELCLILDLVLDASELIVVGSILGLVILRIGSKRVEGCLPRVEWHCLNRRHCTTWRDRALVGWLGVLIWVWNVNFLLLYFELLSSQNVIFLFLITTFFRCLRIQIWTFIACVTVRLDFPRRGGWAHFKGRISSLKEAIRVLAVVINIIEIQEFRELAVGATRVLLWFIKRIDIWTCFQPKVRLLIIDVVDWKEPASAREDLFLVALSIRIVVVGILIWKLCLFIIVWLDLDFHMVTFFLEVRSSLSLDDFSVKFLIGILLYGIQNRVSRRQIWKH